ncbi:MAG: bifunctional (p)ppGpp synthetase/guanosine-3',5'-bis(diphosphate) 3'-pyrophosphohydrolase [Chloroflexi bacterium]|nr:bifunctional (p)ppGpp synthetase/guanosine-3',5'-bis(diphosphate) 3'-pyrophosphohydrolase [Chloroflexota bacterium]
MLKIMELKELTKATSEYLPEKDLQFIEQAYQFALDAEKPDLEKTTEVAAILAHLQMDAESLVAALLQGLPENTMPPSGMTVSKFGKNVKRLAAGVTKLDSIPWLAPDEQQSESLRKMFLAMAKDVRVIIISLANRLQMMRNLKGLPAQTRQDLSHETMEIYVPLAHRLGIREIKSELEDIAFYNLHPEEYREITQLLDVQKNEWKRAITHAIRILRDEFKKAGLKAEIDGRTKSVYSIYEKMLRYADMGKEATDIHDLMALRVLVDEVKDCYNALGMIHHLWHPLHGQFDDYIANPRGNMYESLHTTVMALQGIPLEIQIRTHEMHQINEFGVASHWLYKEGRKKDMHFEEKMTWVRQLMEWRKELSGTAFYDAIKTDIFQDQVYVFTPMGEVKELPQGSTPLDFAYRVHTDLGHRCTGAKVNGRMVPLTYKLQNGDVVSILRTKADRGPSLDWLNPDTGYVHSSHAREKIRQWFRKQERVVNLDRGKELLDKELRRLGIVMSTSEAAKIFGYDDQNEFLPAIGCGDIGVSQIGPRLAPPEEEKIIPATTPVPRKPQVATGVEVLGVGNLLTHIAPCCTPVPGDDIVGFVTRTKGITIHQRNCPNVVQLDEPERLIDVTWGSQQDSYPVSVVLKVEDRVGLLKDVSTIISDSKINISSISTKSNRDNSTSIFLTVEIPNISQLSKLLSKLENLSGVISASRVTTQSKKSASVNRTTKNVSKIKP